VVSDDGGGGDDDSSIRHESGNL